MLILASASPRRSDLLRKWGYQFKLVKAPIEENLPEGVIAEIGVQELAKRKALSGFEAWKSMKEAGNDLILSADTIVVLENGIILGKPEDEEEAEKMLNVLSGKTHRVMTAIALASADGTEKGLWVETDVAVTTVSFRELNTQEIKEYIATGEPMDKAAAYGIQGEAGKFVAEIKGSMTNVIGLPMELLTIKLNQRGIYPGERIRS